MVGRFDFDRYNHFVIQIDVVKSHDIYIIKMPMKTTRPLTRLVTLHIASDFASEYVAT